MPSPIKVKFGLGLNPPLVPRCVFECPSVWAVPQCCDKGRSRGWAAELLLLLQFALRDQYFFEIARVEKGPSEHFSAVIRAAFGAGAMDVNGVPLSWEPKRTGLGGRFSSSPVGWWPTQLMVNRHLVHHDGVAVSPLFLAPTAVAAVLAAAVLISSLETGASRLRRRRRPTDFLATLETDAYHPVFGHRRKAEEQGWVHELVFNILYRVANLADQFFHIRVQRSLAQPFWLLGMLQIQLLFSARLKIDFIRTAHRPFTSAMDLAPLVGRGDIRVGDNAAWGVGSWLQRIGSPQNAAQRRMKAALNRHPPILTYSKEETLAAMAADRNIVFPKRSYMDNVPESHYLQIDSADQVGSDYFIFRDRYNCSNCLSKAEIYRLSEKLARVQADHGALIVKLYEWSDNLELRAAGVVVDAPSELRITLPILGDCFKVAYQARIGPARGLPRQRPRII